MNQGLRAGAAFAALAALAGCTSLSLSGLIAASRLDPLGTPPDEIRVAVGVPDTVRLAPGDAVMRIALSTPSAATPLVAEQVDLQFAPAADPLLAANAADERVYVASIAPQDTARFAAAQRAIREARENGVDGTGALTIRVVGGCFIGPPPSSLPVSSWLQTAPQDGFVPLTRRMDVFTALSPEDGAALRQALQPCGGED